uniref:Uncharacterized protein n=1 Tax=Physcomitrium patens TaxID=3218 RepID=A0A2K1J0U7_PHYPA|nr:hypothetical protein PHYPA_023049 [Physcomitrium patens]
MLVLVLRHRGAAATEVSAALGSRTGAAGISGFLHGVQRVIPVLVLFLFCFVLFFFFPFNSASTMQRCRQFFVLGRVLRLFPIVEWL